MLSYTFKEGYPLDSTNNFGLKQLSTIIKKGTGV